MPSRELAIGEKDPIGLNAGLYSMDSGIAVQHPDEFVVNQLQLQKIPALTAIEKMRARWTNPARSAQDLISAFELRGLPFDR